MWEGVLLTKARTEIHLPNPQIVKEPFAGVCGGSTKGERGQKDDPRKTWWPGL